MKPSKIEINKIVRDYLDIAKEEHLEEQAIVNGSLKEWTTDNDRACLIAALSDLLCNNDKALQDFEKAMINKNRDLALLERRKKKI